MRIYFCDLCNESVPQADLDASKAVFRKGRVVCFRCESAMSGEADPGDETQHEDDAVAPSKAPVGSETTVMDTAGVVPARPAAPSTPGSAGVAVGVALASVALILAVGTAAFLYDQMETRHEALVRDLELARRDAEERGDRLQVRLDSALREVSGDASESRDQVRVLATQIETMAEHQRESIGALREDVYRVIEKTGELDALVAQVDRHDAELVRVATTAASLRNEVGRVGDRLESVQRGGERSRLAAAPAASEKSPEWMSLVGDLSSQNSGTRWQAVQSLGATRDPAVAVHLTPMLHDDDIFVRMATARILGDLEAVVGIAHLIDALEDPEASVREAAVVSLRSITGRDFRFDPGAREVERAKRVKAWRDWWKKAAPDVLPGGNP